MLIFGFTGFSVAEKRQVKMKESDELGDDYDICINGTGLTESILACAAAKCGLKVLHLDMNDYYGREFSSYNLEHFTSLETSQLNSLSKEYRNESCLNFSSTGSLFNIIIDKSAYINTTTPTSQHLSPESSSSRNNNTSSTIHPSYIGYETLLKGPSSQTIEHNTTINISSEQITPVFSTHIYNTILYKQTIQQLLKSSRYYNIDLTYKLLLSYGIAVDNVIKSGVSNYLEFKTLDNIHYYDTKQNKILQVPCNKNDIFNTKLLNILEKRILTKFLSFVHDYGCETAGKSVLRLNEIDLNLGRSLYRPQNKDFNSNGYSLSDYENRSFLDFMTYCKIPVSLQTIIIHCLCLHLRTVEGRSDSGCIDGEDEVDLETSKALLQLSSFLNSLGRYGESALLAPLYGTAEVVQSYCRMAAVWGAVYILRRGVASVDAYAEDEDDDKHVFPEVALAPSESVGDMSQAGCEADRAVAEEIVPAEAEPLYMPASPLLPPLPKTLTIHDSEGNKFHCNAFVTSVEGCPGRFPVKAALLTRVSVLSSPLLPSSKDLLVIPPSTPALSNTHPVYVLQLDSSTSSCAEGSYLQYVTTQVDVFPDNTVYYSGCETGAENQTDWARHVDTQKDSYNTLLAAVITLLLQHSTEAENSYVPVELLYITLTRPLFASPAEEGLSSKAPAVSASSSPLSERVAIVCEGACEYGITIEDNIDHARRIFQRLYPTLEFMHTSERQQELEEEGQTALGLDSEYLELRQLQAMVETATGVSTTTEEENEVDREGEE